MAKMNYESKAQKQQKQKPPSELEIMRRMFNVYAQEANERVSQLMESGTESVALHNAWKQLSWQRKAAFEQAEEQQEGSGRLFSVMDKKDFKSLQREVARINAFLSESSSEVKVASYESKALEAYQKHGLSFHNQVDESFKDDGVRFRGYDQERIKLALEIYRRIEETGAAVIYGLNGKGGFGSDNLFNLIFDEIEGYSPGLSESRIDKIKENAIATGAAAVETFRHNEMYGFLKGSPKSRTKDQNIVSSLAKSSSAVEFFEKNKWIKERSW